MNSIRPIWLLLVAAAPALAQAPQKADAPTAPPTYDSAFAGYRAYQEPAPAPWKDTNARLRQAPGNAGHAGHAGQTGQTGHADHADHAGHDMSGMKNSDAKSDAPTAQKPDPHHAHHHKE